MYMSMKNELAKHNIILKDSKNLIGESRLVINNDGYDMSKYAWAKENPAEMTEMVYTAQAQIE